jgi:hypothetical protein
VHRLDNMGRIALSFVSSRPLPVLPVMIAGSILEPSRGPAYPKVWRPEGAAALGLVWLRAAGDRAASAMLILSAIPTASVMRIAAKRAVDVMVEVPSLCSGGSSGSGSAGCACADVAGWGRLCQKQPQ